MFNKKKILPYNPKLKARARTLRKSGTLGEVLLWKAIRGKTLGCEFHRQVPIDSYIVDFYCHEHRLAIEIDGESHRHEQAGMNDIKRQNELENMGISFLRFSEYTVRNDVDEVVRVIQAWLETKRA